MPMVPRGTKGLTKLPTDCQASNIKEKDAWELPQVSTTNLASFVIHDGQPVASYQFTL